MKSAYEVTCDDHLVGYLGEGPGPFVFASASPLGFPRLKHCRFTCATATYEDDVGLLLEHSSSFEEVVAKLKQAGFVLRAVEHGRAFAEKGPIAGPEVSR